jgi:hypothetical protein
MHLRVADLAFLPPQVLDDTARDTVDNPRLPGGNDTFAEFIPGYHYRMAFEAIAAEMVLINRGYADCRANLEVLEGALAVQIEKKKPSLFRLYLHKPLAGAMDASVVIEG